MPELASLQDRLTQQAPASRTLTQTALHYPLSQPAVAAVIPGASSLEQLRLNIAAAEAAPLTAAEADAVRQASKASVYAAHR
ncbi:Aldo/keto reductase family protein [compost metagenome]